MLRSFHGCILSCWYVRSRLMNLFLFSYQQTQVSCSTNDSLEGDAIAVTRHTGNEFANAHNGERINDGTWSGDHSVIVVDSDGVEVFFNGMPVHKQAVSPDEVSFNINFIHGFLVSHWIQEISFRISLCCIILIL